MPVISTNNAADASLNYLNSNSTLEAQLLAELASGSRIIEASSDPAGLAIGTQLQAQATVFGQDSDNIQQGSAILQTADGALAQISGVLQRMMALATEAASGQVTNTQRSQDINTEYQQLRTEISSIVNSTTYAGQKLLSGSFLSNIQFLVGTMSTTRLTVTVSTVSLAGLGLTGTASAVNTTSAAMAAITAVSTAINTITEDRARVGAYESQFNFSNMDIATNQQNTTAAASVVLDADVAAVKAQLAAVDVRTQAAVAALTQAAMLPQELLALIQSK